MSFDGLAPHYDWLEYLTAGKRLERARTQWLDHLTGRRRILSVGEGHGRFAAACLSRFPEAELTCVDASERMLARARRRTVHLPGRIHWIHQDVCHWQPAQPYDAIVTCFFLDCFPPAALERVVAHLAAAATADAIWLQSDFAIPPRGPARLRARAIHALMYGFFRTFTRLPARRLTPPGPLLRRHGFELTHHRGFEWGLVRAEVWQRVPPPAAIPPET